MSTSNRRAAFAQPQTNPATKFLSWKSDEKTFSYYDKDIAESLKGSSEEEIKEKANVKLNLPFKFLVLDELALVRGWSESLKGNIISNEVKFIGRETISAKVYHKNIKGEKVSTEIAKGIYKDIKEKVNTAGAKYHKSIYVMLEDGTLANIQLKGGAVKVWGEFTQKTKQRLPDEWIVVKESKQEKNGGVKYNVPVFAFERSLSEGEAEMADEAFDILEAYLKAYLVKAEPVVEDIEVNEDEPVGDGLDF